MTSWATIQLKYRIFPALSYLIDDYTTGLNISTNYSRAGNASYIGSDGNYHAVATDTPRIDTTYGYLSELGSTNSVPNGSGDGASAGVVATGWNTPSSAAGSLDSGLTFTVVDAGTSADGMPYVRYRINGTPVGTNGLFLFPVSGALSPAAAQGDTWSVSVYARTHAGSWDNASIAINITERAADNSSLAGIGGTATKPASGAIAGQRMTFTYTLVEATVARMQPWLRVTTVAGEAIDVTFDIALFQAEKNSYATSPIPTSSGAIQRQADNASLPLPWAARYDEAGTLAITAITADLSPSGDAVQVLYELYHSEDDKITFYRDASNKLHCRAFVEGAEAANIPIGVIPNATSFDILFSWQEGTYSAQLGTDTVVTMTDLPFSPALSTIYVGRDVDGNNWGGWITSSELRNNYRAIDIPNWVEAGALIDKDYAHDRYYGMTAAAMIVDRSSTETLYDADGNETTVAANIPAVPAYNPNNGNSPLGLGVWQSNTNFFANSRAPVTQSIDLTGFPARYTIYCLGSGSVDLSGPVTESVIAGDPANGFLGAPAIQVDLDGVDPLTVTVNGTLEYVHVSNVPFPSPPITTNATRKSQSGDKILLPWSVNPVINPLRGTFIIRMYLTQTNQAGTFIALNNGAKEHRLAANWRVRTDPPPDNYSGLTVVVNNVYVIGWDPLGEQMDTVGYHTFGFTYEINEADYSGTINVALDGDVRGVRAMPAGNMPIGLNNMTIGTDNIDDGFQLPLNSYLLRWIYWDEVKDDTALATLTSILGP